MGTRFNPNLGNIGQAQRFERGGQSGFDTGIVIPTADLIVSLVPDMIEPPLRGYGYKRAALLLLAMLTQEYGAKIRTLLLLGEHVLQHPAVPPPTVPPEPELPPSVLAMAQAYAANFSVQTIPGLEGVSNELKRQSRLWLRVTIPNALQVQDVMDRIRANDGVEYVEPYPVMTAPSLVAVPENPPPSPNAFVSMTALPPADWPIKFINRPQRDWDRETYRIAVLDSGCDSNHPALTGCVNYGSTESKTDGYGHGTFVCGVLAAKPTDPSAAGLSTTAGYGKVPPGVTPNAKVLAFNIFDPTPLKAEKLVNGKKTTILTYTIKPDLYFTGMAMLADPNRGGWWKDISVVNMSIRYDGTDTLTERKWLDALAVAKVAVVASSGNADSGLGNNLTLVNPARHPNSLAIGAMDTNYNFWPRTIGGQNSRRLDLYGPGVSVLSALPVTMSGLGRLFSGRLTGTSAAAPFATAAVAMAQAIRGKRERSELLDELKAMPGPRLQWKL